METDREELQKQFDGIPPCVSVKDEEEFRARLLDSIQRLALRENDSDLAHNFLIGLAYLDGIDVEVDRERAVELITASAEAELPEAMEKLRDMYYTGVGVERDYRKVLEWCKRIADFCTKEYGEEHPDTLAALHYLALAYNALGDYKKALELQEKAYQLQREVLGEEHPDTLHSLNNLIFICGKLGYHKRVLLLKQKLNQLRRKGQGNP